MPPDRIMPRRWFHGDTGNWMMKSVLFDAGSRRALVKGERYLGYFIVPAFQRPFVWTLRQQQRLIESIYAGMPLGTLVWNEVQDSPCDGWLLDGQQRMTTIASYVAGEFHVCNWRYSDLPDSERRHFERMSIPVVTTHIADPEKCWDVYERLAYGGTAHAT